MATSTSHHQLGPLPVQYSQRDPEWKNERLGYSDSTIEALGSFLTASATVLSYHGINLSPSQLNKALQRAKGFEGGFVLCDVLSTLYGIRTTLIDCRDNPPPMDVINSFVDEGIPVIVEISPYRKYCSIARWVTIYKRLGDNYWISDPWLLYPDRELITLRHKFGHTWRAEDLITQIFVLDPRVDRYKNYPEIPQVVQDPALLAMLESKPLALPEKKDSLGIKTVRILVPGLIVRPRPDLMESSIGYVNAGEQYYSGGDPISVGGIDWQPITLYVAMGCKKELYVEPVLEE